MKGAFLIGGACLVAAIAYGVGRSYAPQPSEIVVGSGRALSLHSPERNERLKREQDARDEEVRAVRSRFKQSDSEERNRVELGFIPFSPDQLTKAFSQLSIMQGVDGSSSEPDDLHTFKECRSTSEDGTKVYFIAIYRGDDMYLYGRFQDGSDSAMFKSSLERRGESVELGPGHFVGPDANFKFVVNSFRPIEDIADIEVTYSNRMPDRSRVADNYSFDTNYKTIKFQKFVTCGVFEDNL